MIRGRSMLIQRRPPDSVSSTFGVSGCSGGRTTAPRAPRRRRGRFGMGTSRLVRHRRWPSCPPPPEPPFQPLCSRPHSWTHPEGWRDWPNEAPATSRKGKVPIPVRCGGGVPSRNLAPRRPAEVSIRMAAEELKCRECGATYALEARYVCDQCFGPLEVRYEHRRADDPTGTRRRIQGG